MNYNNFILIRYT